MDHVKVAVPGAESGARARVLSLPSLALLTLIQPPESDWPPTGRTSAAEVIGVEGLGAVLVEHRQFGKLDVHDMSLLLSDGHGAAPTGERRCGWSKRFSGVRESFRHRETSFEQTNQQETDDGLHNHSLWREGR